MTDAWDERTEAIPGTVGDRSFELDVDFPVAQPPLARARERTDARNPLEGPALVVFEPAHIGLALSLEAMGYPVRVAATGVDVMSLVAEHPAGAVVCAPSPDAERRRLLAAALRLRFPQVPVVYVSTHARQKEAVLGAIREGARAVLVWPLPPADDVARVLAPYVSRPSQETEVVARFAPPPAGPPADPPAGPSAAPLAAPPAASRRGVTRKAFMTSQPPTDPERQDPLPPPRPWARAVKPASSEDSFDVAATLVDPASAGAPRAAPAQLPAEAMKPLPVPLPVVAVPPPGPLARGRPPSSPAAATGPLPPVAAPPPSEPGDEEIEALTVPGLRPAPEAAVEALHERRGEIGALLAAVSPFLWSLEDAARWADSLAATGDPTAASHARAMHLLAKILAQLQARIDEKEL